ncbi:MAG: hypothetical protein ACI4WH_03325 [Oscillospiraceae bacterium]
MENKKSFLKLILSIILIASTILIIILFFNYKEYISIKKSSNLSNQEIYSISDSVSVNLDSTLSFDCVFRQGRDVTGIRYKINYDDINETNWNSLIVKNLNLSLNDNKFNEYPTQEYKNVDEKYVNSYSCYDKTTKNDFYIYFLDNTYYLEVVNIFHNIELKNSWFE